jgi:hypothetical protein
VAKRCRATLPLALVALHGRLALDWAALGKAAAVKGHADHLKAINEAVFAPPKKTKS